MTKTYLSSLRFSVSLLESRVKLPKEDRSVLNDRRSYTEEYPRWTKTRPSILYDASKLAESIPHSTSSTDSISHKNLPNAAASRIKRCRPMGDICSQGTSPLCMPESKLC